MGNLVRKERSQTEDFFLNALRVATLADERKAKDIKGYDVRGLTLIADSLVICTATSEPQMKAIYNHILEGMKEAGVTPLRKEGPVTGKWLVIDFGNTICHLFREDAREFYDLDGLWADAPEIELDVESDK